MNPADPTEIATGAARGRSVSRPRRTGRAVRAAGVAALLAACCVDLVVAAGLPTPWPPLLVLALGLPALLWPASRRPAWLSATVRTAVPALASLAYSTAVLARGMSVDFGPGELALLLSLLLVAVRTCPPRWALPCGVLISVAVLAVPLRYREDPGSPYPYGMTVIALLLVGCVAGLAGYFRTLDDRRVLAVTETRRAERLAIAADLHDFLAHHVTGILVQARVAQMLAAAEPGPSGPGVPVDEVREKLAPVLVGIESAATEALASMRRTVGVLRDHKGTDKPAGHRPTGDLAAVADLVSGFAAAGPRAVLVRDASVPEGLPHEIQAAAFRVVQEALTNVRRHAADASEVTVALRYDEGSLVVAVRDDGRGGARLPEAARGGGFGLVGLTERVTALGGRIDAGPRSGHGWELVAALPAPPDRGGPGRAA